MSGEESITIMIPTKNRVNFLSRLLDYLADVKYSDWIFVGDSSDTKQLEEVKQVIQNLKDRLKIKHIPCAGSSGIQAAEYMTQFVATPYCVLVPDDDFLCPSGVNKCIDFLEENPEYSAAYGIGINTKTDGSGPYGNISWVHYYNHPPLDKDSGAQRLFDFFSYGTYALVHDVHRIEDWREVVRGFISMPWARQQFHFDGFTPSVISAIRNRSKQLDCLYLVRVGHTGIYFNVDEYDWVTNQDWFAGYKNLHDRAVVELTRQDNIDDKEAEEVFKASFWPFLGWMISRTQQPPPKMRFSKLRLVAGKIPGLRTAYLKTVYRLISNEQQINLLPLLLKPDSPYHRDFMPIYSAITAPKAND